MSKPIFLLFIYLSTYLPVSILLQQNIPTHRATHSRSIVRDTHTQAYVSSLINVITYDMEISSCN